MRVEEIKQTGEIRKTEYFAQIENKLTTAEINREKEIQRKLEAAKKYVNNRFFFSSPSQLFSF